MTQPKGKKACEEEDLAIQDTLTMGVQERLELLANLIIDKIVEDQQNGEPLLKKIMRLQNG
ncbi:MAG TPA: hypothetical protein VMR28_01175 [Candidatus Saccharimonadales bacterium]|nr:hypothetical protein [Candidatus Saccharimonadales bacterium]